MTKRTTEPLLCSICKLPIPAKGTWKHGNNAEPVNSGRCCDDCNNGVVLPLRLLQVFKSKLGGVS